MSAYVELQQREFALEDDGYTATRHQREVGAGYFDDVMTTLSAGGSSTLALAGPPRRPSSRADLTRQRAGVAVTAAVVGAIRPRRLLRPQRVPRGRPAARSTG